MEQWVKLEITEGWAMEALCCESFWKAVTDDDMTQGQIYALHINLRNTQKYPYQKGEINRRSFIGIHLLKSYLKKF